MADQENEQNLAKLKRKRAVLRTSLTKLISKIESSLSKDISLDELEAFLEQLLEKNSCISKMNCEIENFLDEQNISEEVETSEEIKEKILFWKVKLNNKIKSHKPAQDDVVSRNFISIPHIANKDNIDNIKLPKLNINKYYGDPSLWLDFFNMFENTIHNNCKLSKIEKFNYLKSYLGGSAANCINGFALNDENYDSAIALLKERFGNKNLLINAHLGHLLNVTPVKYSYDVHGLRKLYDRAETQIRSLESLGITAESFGNLLCPILMRSIPSELLLEFNRTNNGEDFNLKLLLDFLSKEIQSRERSLFVQKGSFNKPPMQERTQTKHMPVLKHNLKPHSSVASAHEFMASVDDNCIFCKSNTHKSEECDFSLEQKKEILKRQGRCFLCLMPKHRIKDCKSKEMCFICHKKHSPAICYQNENKLKEENKTKPDSQVLSAIADCKSSILLQTCSAVIRTKVKFEPVRLLLDNGSMRSFVTQEISNKLRLPVIKQETLSVFTFGNKTPIEKTFDVVKIKIENKEAPSSKIEIQALVTEHISGSNILPPVLRQRTVKQLMGLQLADSCDCNEPIVILIGADFYYNVVSGNIKRLSKNLVAVETLFGWCLQGQGTDDSSLSLALNVIVEESLISDQIRKFWELESIGIEANSHLPDIYDDEIMQKFESEIKFENNRYIVRLPWKTDTKHRLSDNRKVAEQRFLKLMKRFQNNPELFQAYKAIFNDYLQQKIIEIVPENPDNKNQITFYLPHREIIRDDRLSSKLRIVFDGSSHDSGEIPLNSCLHVGPNLYPEIFDLLLSFRFNPIAFTGDIKQAFLQIEVDEKDRDVTRFLFSDNPIDESRSLITYRFTRVLFGLNSSPFLLAATIKHHLKKYTELFPETAKFLNENIYVDDVIGGHQDVERAFITSLECVQIFKEAGMILHKWQTNSKELNEMWKKEGIASEDRSSVLEHTDPPFKVLGIAWDNVGDFLYFDIRHLLQFLSKRISTKRFLLQAIGRLYDPVGYLGAFTFRIKCLIQQIWILGIDWDDELPEHLKTAWEAWCEEVQDLSEFKIPRYYLSGISNRNVEQVELHCFSDASNKGYGTIAYLRILLSDERVHTVFVASKSRVAPLKPISLPRLELMGALLSARLSSRITKSLKFQLSHYFWTDSKITFFWIKGSSVKFKPFVKNRVEEIQKLSSPSDWYHCPGKENPADLVSRGAKLSELKGNSVWLNGPEWLLLTSEFWPRVDDKKITDEEELEYRKNYENIQQFTCTVIDEKRLLDISKYSTLSRLLQTTAWVKRFILKLKKLSNETGPITAEELIDAEFYWIKTEQKHFFSDEIESLKLKNSVAKKSTLYNFAPYLDKQEILRIGGRLEHSSFLIDEKHPVILPKNSILTELIVIKEHNKIMHGGTAATLAKLRERFWIPKGRQLVKKIIKKCLICQRYSAKPANQLTSQLPEDRINKTPPFYVTGIDFIGPIYVKNFEKTQKSYITLFTCAVTRALHLELVPNMTTDSFLLAFRRFTARRGNCHVIYSDNAKTFKKSKTELERLSKVFSDDVFRNFIAKEGINWKFIVERAAWWGGFYERLVRSIKECLRKILGKALLTFEEMSTVLTELEAVLNLRPLTYVYNDNEEPQPLSPMHFLNFGQKQQTFPITLSELLSEGANRSSLKKRKRYQDLLLKQLWTKWKKLYLMELRTAHHLKNPNVSENLKIGDIVMIEGDNKSKLLWKVGKVVDVFAGRDGKVRSVELKTSNGTLKRSVQHIYPLEL